RELLLNPAFWGCLAVLLIVLWKATMGGRRAAGVEQAQTAIRRFLTEPLPLALFLFAGIARAGFAAYMSYIAPFDVMQDGVSAQQLLAADSAYPSDMREKIGDTLIRNPPAVLLGRWLPSLRQKEEWDTRSSLWLQALAAQAHPPLQLILTV